MSETIDATLYVQVEPEFARWPANDPPVIGARPTRMTQKRPDKPKPGSVLVKLTVRLPKSAFMPLRPEAIVVVPESLALPTPVTVQAVDPNLSEVTT
jgi:hypothetical protein